MRHTLVVTEIALAVVLLVGSGLMMRTFQSLRHVDPGFVSPADVLTFRVSVPGSLVADGEQALPVHHESPWRATCPLPVRLEPTRPPPCAHSRRQSSRTSD